jgi:hypothetical protein
MTRRLPASQAKFKLGIPRRLKQRTGSQNGCIVLPAFKFKKEIQLDFKLLPSRETCDPVAIDFVFDGVGQRAVTRSGTARP